MEGPRTPSTTELPRVVEFLDNQLRQNNNWTIASEYPTALSTSNIHNMSIITDDDKIISHAVLKTFVIKAPQAIFKVGAIGSVVTDPNYRQQGHSTSNINKCIELASQQDCDLVILWTDQFDFYRKLGFELAGYDYSYVFDSAEPIKNKTIRFVTGNNVDPSAIAKLYSQHTVHAVRNNEDFRQFLKIPNSNLFTAWDQNNQLLAYAVEGKGIDLINYIHEWAGQTEVLLDLFKYIRNQKQQPITIMCPAHSINLRKKLDEMSQLGHQGFLGMIKAVNTESLLTKVKKAFRAEGFEKIVFEKQGNGVVFGFGTDLYTFDKESDVLSLIFGPLNVNQIDYISTDTKEKLSKLLPLPLWIWGWDSI
jgi:ribosomal protein S18 acetylase RimI-like enzyme